MKCFFTKTSLWIVGILSLASCGKIQEVVTQTSNQIQLPGHWLMTESEHSSAVDKFLENESLVLSFADGKMAFSPADSAKGQAVYSTLSDCTKGPRAYRVEGKQIVLPAIPGCAERRVNLEMLNATTLKFPDPDKSDVTRVLVRIDEARYHSLVKASDRKL
jgi:hypothetical protein